jgi:glutathione peroxidase
MIMQTATRSMSIFLGFGLLVATATAWSGQPGDGAKPSAPAAAKPAPVDACILSHTMKDIDGKDQPLEQYRGKVILVVNVASKCGYTRQYAGLETLYKTYKDKGLVILGFPANDFGGQEPGTDAEIKSFCTGKYNVTFPMFSKIAVTGANAHPLYKQLAAQPGLAGGEPKWNFNKYLCDRDGKVVEHFESGVKPDSDELKKKIEAMLESKPAGAK